MNTSLSTIQPANMAQFRFSSDLFTRFMDYCDVKDSTIQGYTVALRHFVEWFKAQQITQPTREDIKAYKEHLATATNEKGKGFTATTQARYFRACKLFFKWCAAEGFYPNIADNIKSSKVRMDVHYRDALSENAVYEMLENCIDRSAETGKRDFILILLCVTCGFRLVECQRANIEDIQVLDINDEKQPVLFIQGKGHDAKDAYKKIVPAAYDAINDYLATRHGWKKCDPLFVATGNRANGARLSVASLSRIVKTIIEKAGYDSSRLTAHSLRHSSITFYLRKKGTTLQQAQAHARHSNPATTEIYAHNIEQENEYPELDVYNRIYGIKDEKQVEFEKLFSSLTKSAQDETIVFMRALQKLAV